MDTAIALLRDATVVARQIPDGQKRAEALARVVEGLAAAGQFAEGAGLLGQIVPRAALSDALRALAEGLAEAGQTAQAAEFARRIADRFRQSMACKRTVRAFVAAGQFAEAAALAGEVSEWQIRQEAQAHVVRGLAEAGLLAEAAEQARRIADPWGRALALGWVVGALAEAQRLPEARALLDEATGAAYQLPQIYWRTEALSDVAQTLAEAGQAAAAWELTAQIADERERSEAEQQVAQALASARRPASVARRAGARTGADAGVFGAAAETLAAASHLTAVADLLEEFTKHPRNLYQRPEQALDVGRALAAARLAAAAAGQLLPDAEAAAQHAARAPLVPEAALLRARCWDAVVDCALHALDLAHLLSHRDGLWERAVRLLCRLPELDALLAIVQRRWSVAAGSDELYTLLPAAVPLLLADPALLPQLLAGEAWVREQFRW